MKLLIAFDGSDCAEAAVHDLVHAGLPAEGEAMVLSVAHAEVPVWATMGGEAFPLPSLGAMQGVVGGPSSAEFSQASEIAERGAVQLRTLLPNWRIEEDTAVGNIAEEVVSRARNWEADLIVVGSHGYRTIPRLFLGSVSHQVLKHASCTVRVGRHSRYETEHRPLRVLVCYDASSGAKAALKAVCQRIWPAGTEARVLMAVEADVPASVPIVAAPYPARLDVEDRAERCLVEARQDLARAGLRVDHVAEIGDAKHVILNMAEDWPADVVFIGSHGRTGLARLLLGSVSQAVAESAGCSAEVVRN